MLFNVTTVSSSSQIDMEPSTSAPIMPALEPAEPMSQSAMLADIHSICNASFHMVRGIKETVQEGVHAMDEIRRRIVALEAETRLIRQHISPGGICTPEMSTCRWKKAFSMESVAEMEKALRDEDTYASLVRLI